MKYGYLALVLLLAACGGGNGGGGQQTPPPQNPPPPPPNTIGPAGGTVNGPNGSRVVIPAGALSQPIAIAITASSAGAPALPAGVPAASQVFALTPHGTAFAMPVTVTLPYDPLAVPANASTTVRKTNATQSGWEPVAIQSISNNEIAVQTTSFSWVYVGYTSPLPPVTGGRIGGGNSAQFSGFSVARLANGRLLSWGSDAREQLGAGPGSDDRNVPGPLTVELSDVTSISVGIGGASVIALRTGGIVWGWGDNTSGALGGPEELVDRPREIADVSATAICTSGEHSLFLQDDGTVLALGGNRVGMLGDGTTETRRSPVPVVGLADVIAIACRSSFSLALLRDGTLRAWGFNANGQLGDGTTTDRHVPVPVVGLSNVTAIATGNFHSLALLNDGSVWAWGANDSGQLGDGAPGPVPLPPNDRSLVPKATLANANFVAIAGGYDTSMALRSDGTVFMWGNNRYGQLGISDPNNPGGTGNTSTPVQVPDLTDVIEIALPGYHVMAARSDGTVWAWGRNEVGEIGNGQQGPPVVRPQQVVGLDLD